MTKKINSRFYPCDINEIYTINNKPNSPNWFIIIVGVILFILYVIYQAHK